MRFFPALKLSTVFFRSCAVFIFLIFLFIFHKINRPPVVYAQTNTPTPTATLTPAATLTPIPPTPTIGGPPSADVVEWEFDPEVTVVGKGSDRARQFLWWILSHPGIHSASVIAELWAFSRNVVYVFVILVIIAFGLGLILSRKETPLGPIFSGIASPLYGVNITSVFFKVATLLLYVTFSYVLVLALIQTSEITMRFVIEYVGGRNLFNIIFSGTGNTEANYTSFIGYKHRNLLSLEMVKTSLFVIKLTSFTYYVMAVLLVLRTIILWLLLILSPFLALLMPFIFIRNIGWIWIGVFFQWLFYGPLVYLFLASLARIWIAGIPYSFDFSRTDQPEGQIYRTAINILYGGPAQTLSVGNSANYIDTYAEYLIALIMLWASIILPWLLLRIFRDYCCEAIAAGNAALTGIFDRIRQYPPPPPTTTPPAPTTIAGLAVGLPFRQRIEEKVRETITSKIGAVKEISQIKTVDIARRMELSVSSLSEISRMQTNELERKQIETRLNKIALPQIAASSVERGQYEIIRNELNKRAIAGDTIAQTILAAAENKREELVSKIASISAQRATVPTTITKTAFAPTIAVSPIAIPSSQVVSQPIVIKEVAEKTSTSERKVKEVISLQPTVAVPSLQVAVALAQKTGLSQEKIKEIMTVAQGILAKAPSRKVVAKPARKGVPVSMAGKEVETQVSVEDYEEVKKMWLHHFREAPVPVSEVIKDRRKWLTEEEKSLTNISHLLSSSDPVLKQEGLVKVAEILPFMLLGEFSDAEVLAYIKAKLEAARQIKTEQDILEKAKEEAKKEIKEEEETLLEIPAEKKKEKEKYFTAEKEKNVT